MATSPPRNGSSTPWSERIVSAFCAGFALWTVSSQLVVALGGSFLDLLFTATTLTLTAGTAVVIAMRTRTPAFLGLWGSEQAELPDPSTVSLPGGRALSGRSRLLVRWGVLVASASAAPLSSSHPLILWWVIAICLAIGGWLSFASEPSVAPTPEPRREHELIVWGLALACAGYALVCHRPDADDSFYVNIAAAAMDRPDLPLFATDTLHGLSSFSVHLPVYKLHSWELLNAAIGLFLDLSALSAFHFVAATLVSVLAPLAWASLLRRLTPRYWPATLVSVLVVLIAVGDVHRWYGNFSFVRIWQGKALFLTVLLPLIWSYALRFARRPSWTSGLWLAASQIAAVGATSSALWAAPAAAATAIVSAVSGRRAWVPLVGVGAVSTYALLLGVNLQSGMHWLAERAGNLTGSPGALLEQTLGTVLGEGLLLRISLVALAAAWTVAPRGPARRFASITPLAVWASILNPYLGTIVAVHLTGPSHWRTMWILPIPLLLALAATTPLTWSRGGAGSPRLENRWAVALWLLLLVGFAASVPAVHGWSPENEHNEVGLPHHKVPPEATLARLIRAHVPPGTVVVAPSQVNVWLPVLNRHPYPLKVLDYLRLKGFPNRDRVGMIRLAYLDGRTPKGVAEFRRGLSRLNVGAVLFYLRNRRGNELLAATLLEAGFEQVEGKEKWELWVRRKRDPRGDPYPDQPLEFPFFENR